MATTIELSKMSPAQQKRLGDLMMRDISATLNARSNFQYQRLNTVTMTNDIDALLDNIERTQEAKRAEIENHTHKLIEQKLSREQLFRFAYVPFVIAELVWDYADTVIIMARDRSLNASATRKLSRVIRNARNDYDYLRRRYIDESNREREIENGYVFEKAVKRITDQCLLNVRLDLKDEYPQLNEASEMLLLSVYQCHILSKALLLYISRETAKVSKLIGLSVGDILPQGYYVMDKLIPEFIGDKPASDKFKKLMKQYIESLAVQIGLIGLNDTSPDDDSAN